MNIFLGIDNGKDGGIAAVDENGSIQLSVAMPVLTGKRKEYDTKVIIELFENLISLQNGKVVCAALEKSFCMPINGAKQNFTIGQDYGLIQGILSCLRIPYVVVRPQEWQKKMLNGETIKDTKQASILYCQRKYPDADFTKTQRSRKIHDGITDALCLANYARLYL